MLTIPSISVQDYICLVNMVTCLSLVPAGEFFPERFRVSATEKQVYW